MFIWLALGKQTFINYNLHLDFSHINFPLVYSAMKLPLKKSRVEQLALSIEYVFGSLSKVKGLKFETTKFNEMK